MTSKNEFSNIQIQSAAKLENSFFDVAKRLKLTFWSFLSVVAFVMTVILSTKCVVFPSYQSQFQELKSYHILFLFQSTR